MKQGSGNVSSFTVLQTGLGAVHIPSGLSLSFKKEPQNEAVWMSLMCLSRVVLLRTRGVLKYPDRRDVLDTLLMVDQMAEKNKLMVNVVGLTAGGDTVHHGGDACGT